MRKNVVVSLGIVVLFLSISIAFPSSKTIELKGELNCSKVLGCKGTPTCGGPGYILNDCYLDCNGDMEWDVKCDPANN